jgi:hypothetical protein
MKGALSLKQETIAFRWRWVVPFGAALGFLLLWLTPTNDYFVQGTWMGGNHFPPAIVSLLLLVAWGLNPLLRSFGRQWSAAELTLFAALLLAVSGLASSGLMRHLIPLLAAPRYFARLFPEWLPQDLPSWLILNEVNAVRAFYEGTSLSVGEWIQAWLPPLLCWGALVLLLWGGCWMLTEPLWRQWAQRERFTFPIPTLLHHCLVPSLATDLRRSRAFWVGVSLSAIVHGINLANAFLPSVPSIPLRVSLSPHLTSLPWSALAPLELHVYPSAIGMSFLIAGDVAMGFALFYWLAKVQRLVAAWLGWQPSLSFGRALPTFLVAQQMGATVAFALGLARKIINLAAEDLKVRRQLFGWLICLLGVVLWSWLVGIPLLLSVAIALGYFVLATVIAWAVTNGGLLFVQTTFLPAEFVLLWRGTEGLTAKASVTLALQQWSLMFNFREHPLPHLLHGVHLAHLTGAPLLPLRCWQIIALMLGSLMAGVSFSSLVRRVGALRLRPFDFFQLPQSVLRIAHTWHDQPSPPQWGQLFWLGVGALLWEGVLRLRYLCQWLPHPIGWLFAESYAAQMFWLSFALGALKKMLVTRYGGLMTYQRCHPFFVGMVIGDTLMATASIFLAWLTPIRYTILPN